jgi:hypothetical protein
MAVTAEYDQAYLNKYVGYEASDIGKRINQARLKTVEQYGDGALLDIGIGSGMFLKSYPDAMGYDINRAAVSWLRKKNRYSEDFNKFKAFTMWDVLEHCEAPEVYFKRFPIGALLFVSIPIFSDLGSIRQSKHYRPGEHLYYFTDEGFKFYMGLHGFELLGWNNLETKAGREDIGTYIFRKSPPSYHINIGQYQELHTRFYGSSSMLHFDVISKYILDSDIRSILDYGCGRSELACYFWADGKRKIERYDPAIPNFSIMPDGTFDLVLCNDVLEHIEMQDVDRVIQEIQAKGKKAIFTISTKPARAKLPDGRNAHVTLLTESEWMKWLLDYYDNVEKIDTGYDHIVGAAAWNT